MLHTRTGTLPGQLSRTFGVYAQVFVVRLGIGSFRGDVSQPGEVHHGINIGQGLTPVCPRPEFRRADIKKPGLFDPGAAAGNYLVSVSVKLKAELRADKSRSARNKDSHIKNDWSADFPAATRQYVRAFIFSHRAGAQ